MTADERAVLAANEAFYRAFAARDVEAMEALWARRVPAACIHPGWQVLNGREAVMASWRGILGGVPLAIRCADAVARVAGTAAFVVCTERLDAGELVATNVFVQEDGDWKIAHHHAGPVASGDEDDEGGPRSGFLN
jgi:ketosteroid isomerase-like protein